MRANLLIRMMTSARSISAICILVGLTAAIHLGESRKTAPAEARNNTKVERNITLILADDGLVAAPTALTSQTEEGEQEEGKEEERAKGKKKRKIVSFKIDESTKLIYIDKETESGLLTSEIISSSGVSRSTSKPPAAIASDESWTTARVRETPVVKNGPNIDGAKEASGSTNYSVFLVSRHPEHIAVLLDIEEIDFEPTINCENQEIRFSIIGEISKQLLMQKEAGDESSTSAENPADESSSSDAEERDETKSSSQQEITTSPPLPVSEAMTLLMNAPLNKTILDDSGEPNDFKIIGSTIDYLHERTCNDLKIEQQAHNSQRRTESGRAQNRTTSREGEQTRRGGKSDRRRRGPLSRARAPPNHRHSQERRPCTQDSPRFRALMFERLRDNFEWEEFKIICGKTKQLVIPMRSLKIGIYSDEFSPNSSFKLRYKFISDPKLLPAFDNGKYFCRNRNIIDLALKCNGIDDCGDASDESIKTCGYPAGRNGESISSLAPSPSMQASWWAANRSAEHRAGSASSQSRLTYVKGDVLHCCQSSEWLSLMPQAQTNRLSLQSLIGDSMNLFPNSIFTPTTGKAGQSDARPRGRRRLKRIVGGGVSPKGMWPGQASLQYELMEPLCHFCAGTLIHPQYVLTAGHCITKDGLTRGIKVVFGAHDLRQLSGNHIQVRYVDDAHIYPGVDVKQLNFDWENDMNNDIALLRLNAPVLVTQHVAPACLPPFNRPPAVGSNCDAIGWGQTHGSGSSNLLKQLSLGVVDSYNCSKELVDQEEDDRATTTPVRESDYENGNATKATGTGTGPKSASTEGTTSPEQYRDETMICVKNESGHGICQGDSGGPLYCERTNSKGERCTEIYGVASFIIQYATVGAMCAVEKLPEVFSEVSSKTEWISSTMKMFEQTYKLKYS